MKQWLEKAIAKKNAKKSKQRKKFSIWLMHQYPGYSCKKCIHGLSKCCTDKLRNACEFFCNAKTNERFELEPREVKKKFKAFIA